MSSTANESNLIRTADRAISMIRCEECALVQTAPALVDHESAHCKRCGAHLCKQVSNTIDRTLALVLAALVLLIVANATPFMTFSFKGRSESNYILSGVIQLWNHGYWPLALLICFASILAPMTYILGMLYVLIPVSLGRRPWKVGPLFRRLDALRPWAMLDVYMFGVFVAVVKLSQLAAIAPSLGLYAYVTLFIVWTAALAGLDSRAVWSAIGPQPAPEAIPPKLDAGWMICPSCRLPTRRGQDLDDSHFRCPRCEGPMDPRKHGSISKTWAFLIAATILYIPANTLPILEITIMGKTQKTTIFEGVQELVATGMWGIGIIVFTASILVPTLKIVGLAALCLSVQKSTRRLSADRAVLYRWIETIGRWSMIDMFMVSILVALVQLGGLATILPEAGALCFAAVVILTMFAATAFDPKMIWDNLEKT